MTGSTLAAQAKSRKIKGWGPANVTVYEPPDLKSWQGLPPNRFTAYNSRAATAPRAKLYPLIIFAMASSTRNKLAPQPEDNGGEDETLLNPADLLGGAPQPGDNGGEDETLQEDGDGEPKAPLSLADLLKIGATAKSPSRAKGGDGSGRANQPPIAWNPATIAAASALPVPLELPARYPSRGPSGQLQGPPAFVAAPKDLEALNQATCPDRRNDPLLAVIRAALLNDWHGHRMHRGASAADGGTLPVELLLTVLATVPMQQKARKWAQQLAGSGQTNLLAQCANVAGRFAILRPQGITLVRDFYASTN